MTEELKVCASDYAFFGAFQRIFPQIELLKEPRDVMEYDLVIFPGGSDINPSFYGEPNKYCGFIDKNRDSIEKVIFKNAYYRSKNTKILGICRGHQLINAILGGYLIQDLKVEMGDNHPSGHSLKLIKITEFSKIYKQVNSMHHQGVLHPGKGLSITTKYNGVIESTENDKIISVQYHPEFMGGVATDQFFSMVKLWARKKVGKNFYMPTEDEIFAEKRRRMSERIRPDRERGRVRIEPREEIFTNPFESPPDISSETVQFDDGSEEFLGSFERQDNLDEE